MEEHLQEKESQLKDLSVIIAARNEEFLPNTISSVLSASTADTEVIVVLDGYTPDPPIGASPYNPIGA